MATKNLEVRIATGDELDVGTFQVADALSSLFVVTLIVLTKNQSIDFDGVVGQPAAFAIHQNAIGDRAPVSRVWNGVCSQIRLIQVEDKGLATYSVTIVPDLWLATQRQNYRIYQQISELDIALKVLGEWGIEPVVELDKGAYKKRKYKVQYAESDFAFISRMLEECGVTYYFRQEGDQTKLVLTDAPQNNKPRAAKIPYSDSPSHAVFASTYVTKVGIVQKVRPGRYTLRDHDYRLQPEYNLLATWQDGLSIEQRLERYHYTPGGFLFHAEKGDDTPFADDKGKTRTDESEGKKIAQKRLEAKRVDQKLFAFDTNAFDLAPGAVVSFLNHPRPDLGEDKKLLVLETMFGGTSVAEWHLECTAMSADSPYRPALKTPRPHVRGVESATVVGPKGEEIHVDEFGRVRVHFHWDRWDSWDDNSSCWIHVSQPWAGTAFGGTNLPRVGQEVLVEFLGGDPDRPIIVGRVYTNLQKKPYKLPDNKTQSGWKSNSTNHTGGYNELMFEDKAGSELVRMQAEKDMTLLVKHDQTNTIKNNRTTYIGTDGGGDDTEICFQNQYVSIKKDQVFQVHQNQTDIVRQQITIASLEEGIKVQAPKVIEITAGKQIKLTVGKSYIVIQDDGIIVQSPHTEINPENAKKGSDEAPSENNESQHE
ncbi:MAG TPA: type VI secretion system tip protein TssI/VgrG [Minicystis sp.]|nr:type VI secretion system tip protein TssI/VgrG [Minicystis sp.]